MPVEGGCGRGTLVGSFRKSEKGNGSEANWYPKNGIRTRRITKGLVSSMRRILLEF
jgi:hypothetical protein